MVTRVMLLPYQMAGNDTSMQMLMGSDMMVAMSDSMSDTMSDTYSEIRASTGEETWKLYSQEEQFIRVMMATDMVNIKTSLTDLSGPIDQRWFSSFLAGAHTYTLWRGKSLTHRYTNTALIEFYCTTTTFSDNSASMSILYLKVVRVFF